MKKILKVCACGLVVTMLAAGCSKKAAVDETTTAVTDETTASTAEETLAEPVDLSGIDFGTVTLGEYKGIKATKPVTEVTDEELNAAIDSELERNPQAVDRAVKTGDTVNIDYVGTKDDVAFDGGTAEGYDLTIGSGQFIPGFEDGLVGAKKGEEVTLDLTFPEEYGNTDLAGQKVQFKVTVNEVKEVPVLSDAVVQTISEFKTVDEYKADKKQTLLAEKEAQAEDEVKNTVFNSAIEVSAFETSEEAIDANYQNMLLSYTSQASMYGMDLAAMASMYGMTEDTFKEQLKVMAESSVKQHLLVRAIADKENITVSDEERASLAAEMGYEDKDTMIESAGEVTVDDYLLSNKIADFLVENAVIQ